MTAEENKAFSSRLPVQILVRSNLEQGWQDFDVGPGIFHIPEGHEVGLRIKNSSDDDLFQLIAEWHECQALVMLNLSENRKITDEGIEKLRSLSRLRELNLSSCDITNDAIPFLKSLSSLQNLNLSYCHRITDQGLKAITDLRRLNFLDLQGCPRISRGGLARIRRAGLIIHR